MAMKSLKLRYFMLQITALYKLIHLLKNVTPIATSIILTNYINTNTNW
jgi:hypothetical protein